MYQILVRKFKDDIENLSFDVPISFKIRWELFLDELKVNFHNVLFWNVLNKFYIIFLYTLHILLVICSFYKSSFYIDVMWNFFWTANKIFNKATKSMCSSSHTSFSIHNKLYSRCQLYTLELVPDFFVILLLVFNMGICKFKSLKSGNPIDQKGH